MGLSFLFLQLDFLDQWVVIPYQRAVAQISGCLLRAVGITHQVEGSTIILRTISLNVDRSCTGLFAMCVFCSSVISFLSRIREKLIGIGLGILIIFLFNLVRVFSLCLMALYARPWLGPAHNVGWQILMIFIILFSWLFWEERIVKG